MVPGAVVPSPQSMVAVKDDAVSARLVSVKLATSVVFASATVSVALARSNWPDSGIGFFSSVRRFSRRRDAASPFQPISQVLQRSTRRGANLPNADAASMWQAQGALPREASLVGRVGLFLDDRGACYLVDPALEPRALVVEPVDRARKLDETLSEVVPLLERPQFVFHVPEPAVDLQQLLFERGKVGRGKRRARADLQQPVKLALDVVLRRGGADPFPLDAQYRNLVDKLADRNRRKDVNHRERHREVSARS